MNTYVIGDIHGRIEALKEVLGLSKFNYEEDTLIVLGDIVDGGYNTYEVVEELLKIKHLIFVIGNHDIWFMNHVHSGWAGEIWLTQGGHNTLKSYNPHFPLGKEHQEFFNKAVPYYVRDNMLFVHGGFDARHGKTIDQCSLEFITWDRDLIEYAQEGNKIPGYHKVFVGHTTTQSYSYECIPIQFSNLTMMDCGAGWTGRLAIMNIYNGKYWVSAKQEPAR